MTPPLVVEHENSTAHLRLSRPGVLNALDHGLVSALTEAVRQAVDDGARALVLSGSGRAFCAGADLDAVTRMDANAMGAYLRDLQALADAVRQCPVPTIAAVHGAAIGGGLELAVNCDVRIAGTDATFACPEARWGLLPTNGSSQLLRELIGDGWAREMLLFGTRLDAHSAARIGLVTRVVPNHELPAVIASMTTTVDDAYGPAIAATKRLLNRATESWPDLLGAELTELDPVVGSGEYLRRIAGARG